MRARNMRRADPVPMENTRVWSKDIMRHEITSVEFAAHANREGEPVSTRNLLSFGWHALTDQAGH